ncbi:GPP34 family phosphoprotein [Streptomyces sp. NPDC059165]|uniref:GOLPH3/VPS74 family protein n=1 Tax=Streptomyces sp. NPDC059165 TaxID=3346751 RepID=UPI003683851E
MHVTLGEEVALLSLDEESGTMKNRSAAGWAVAGGTLLELAMAERVSVTDGRVVVIDAAPTGIALLDGRLAEIASWTERRGWGKAGKWLAKDHPAAVRAAVHSLCGRGVVVEERLRALGLFPVRRYSGADGTVAREVRGRLSGAVLGGGTPDPRTCGLIALLHAARLHPLAFPGTPRKKVEPRMAEIAEGQWAGAVVREAIRTMQAAVAAGVVAATTASGS